MQEQELFDALSNPGSWTQTQWMAVIIGLLVLVAAFYFAWKLVQIIRNAGKSTYKPNIGRSRLQQEGREPGSAAGRDPGSQEEDRERE